MRRVVNGVAEPERIDRCPDCVPPASRESLLVGVERVVTWADWRPNSALIEAENAIRALLAGERWCVFLRGRWGIGKTMLAKIAAWEWTARGEHVVVVNVPDLLANLKETFDDDRNTTSDTYAYRFESYATAPLLVLDDLGKEYATKWAREAMYRLIDRRYAGRRPLIVTSNVEGDELEPAVRSRLGPGEIVIKNAADQRKVYER